MTKLISSRLVTLLTRCFDTDQPPNPIRLTLPASVCMPQWNLSLFEFASYNIKFRFSAAIFLELWVWGDCSSTSLGPTSESYSINSPRECVHATMEPKYSWICILPIFMNFCNIMIQIFWKPASQRLHLKVFFFSWTNRKCSSYLTHATMEPKSSWIWIFF